MTVGLFNPAYANRMTGLFGLGGNTGVVPPNRIPGVGNPRPTIPGGTPMPAPHPMTVPGQQVPAITNTNGIPNADSVNNASITANQQNAGYNNAMTHGNTTGPTGSQTFTSHIDPKTGATVYDQNISLPAAQQQVLNQQNADKVGLSQTASGLLPQIAAANTPLTAQALQDRINMGGVTSQLFGGNDLLGARQQVQDALYKRQASYLDPQYQQSDTAMRTRLANQGITEGSEAWKNAIDEFNRGKSFDYAQARGDAITGGMNEMQGLSGMALNNRQEQFGEANTDMQTHNQALQEQLARTMTLRADPLNRYKALTDQAGVTIPQFNNPAIPLAQNTDISGNAYRSYEDQLAAQNARNANSNATKAGLFGLASDVITSKLGSKIGNGIVNYGKGLFGKGAPTQAAGASATGDAGAGTLAGLGQVGAGAGLAGTGAGLLGAGAGAGAAGAGAGALGGTIGVTESLGTAGLPAIGTLGGAGAGAAGAGGAVAGAGGAGAGAAGAGAVGSGAGAGMGGGASYSAGASAAPTTGTGAFASGGAGTVAGTALGAATLAYAGASMIHDMTGHGSSVGLNDVPLAPGVTKTTTTGGQGALAVGNMVYGLGSMGKQGGSMNWFVKGADGKQQWVGADANNVISDYASRGSIAPPGQGQNGRGLINEPGTTSALSAAQYTQQRMQGYYDKLGGQAAIGTTLAGWLKQLRDVGQSIKFNSGDTGLWGS